MSKFKLEKYKAYSGFRKNDVTWFMEESDFAIVADLIDLPKEIEVLNNALLGWWKPIKASLPYVVTSNQQIDQYKLIEKIMTETHPDSMLPIKVSINLVDKGNNGIMRIVSIPEDFMSNKSIEIEERYYQTYVEACRIMIRNGESPQLKLCGNIDFDGRLNAFIISESDLGYQILGYFRDFQAEQTEIEFDDPVNRAMQGLHDVCKKTGTSMTISNGSKSATINGEDQA